MRKVAYPDWVEKFRSPGHSIKKTKYGYALYKCTSVYQKGKLPVSKQTYLGAITEKDGFIPKKVVGDFGEYGLSRFIYDSYSRQLRRAIYNSSDDLVKLSIVSFVFNRVDDTFIRCCYLTRHDAKHFITYRDSIDSKRILTGKRKVEQILQDVFTDESDFNCVVKLLFLLQPNMDIPKELTSIFEKYGIDYEK